MSRGLVLIMSAFYCMVSFSTAEAANWYVNDTSTLGDSYTTAAGADTHPGTAGMPFRHIKQAIDSAASGDTIYIDAGIFDSYVHDATAAETYGVNINKDSIALIGKDSASTIIDPPGPVSQTALYAIYADTQTGLLIENLGLTGAYFGIRLINVDASKITRDSACDNGHTGIYLSEGSTLNTLSHNFAHFNDGLGGAFDRGGIVLDGSSGNNTIETNVTNSNNMNGIYVNTSNDTISGNSAASNNSYGIWIAAGNNLVTGNTLTSNSSAGIRLSNCSNNTVRGNTTTSGSYGIDLYSGGSDNIIQNNVIRANTAQGIHLEGSNTNHLIIGNLIADNAQYGIQIIGGSGHVLVQNTFDSNVSYQVHLTSNSSYGLASSDTFLKNNFKPSTTNPDSAVLNTTNNTFEFSRNWWGSADSVTVDKRAADTASPKKIKFQPYRLALVDTTSNGDTTAPDAPDTVAVVGTPDTSIILEWTAATALEEPSNGGAVGLSKYIVYRSESKDTSSWVKVSQPASGTIRYQDTDVIPGRIYYYRVTAQDAATFINESYFSDSQPSDSAPFTSTVNWYVNDGSTSGDSWTTATGSDVTGLGTVGKPFASIPRVMQVATAGDTIFIDAGLFDSYVVVSATETAGVNITQDSITLLGKDSSATVIDPPGATSISGLYGIYASGKTGLLIKDVAVTGAQDGIVFNNVDASTVTSDSVHSTGRYGIYVSNGSDTNTVRNNEAIGNGQSGVFVSTSDFNTVENNIAKSAGVNGNIRLFSSKQNKVRRNTANSGGDYGLWLDSANDNTVDSNTFNSNGQYGIFFNSGSSNTVYGNTCNSNSQIGVYSSSGSNNVIRQNIITSNSQDGIRLSGADANIVMNNIVNNNTLMGIDIRGGADSNVIVQNDFNGNSDTGIKIQSGSINNVITKNNVVGSGKGHFDNQTGNPQTVTRNWFGLTDTAALGKKIFDTAAGWHPYRLGLVDTVLGADTTAPKAPDSVAADGDVSDTSIIVTWSAVSTQEEGVTGGPSLSAYNIYRSAVKDTSSWLQIGNTTAALFQDTDVIPGRVYYYRVTAYDTATPFKNESFFSDSQPSDSAPFANTINWYANDGSSTGDSFTYSLGSDITGLGTANKPFASIVAAMRWATAGDTVFVDAGFYDSYAWGGLSAGDTAGVRIDKDSITLIGKDSASTTINPPGESTVTNLSGILLSASGIRIRNVGVTGANYGIVSYGSLRSSVEQCSATYNNVGVGAGWNTETFTVTGGNYSSNLTGVSFDASSCTITGVTANSNSSNGIFVTGHGGNMISNNTANSNVTGINNDNSSRNIITGNTCVSNTNNGMYVGSGSDTSTVTNNTLQSNVAHGILAAGSLGSTFTGNTVTGNSTGIGFSTASNGVVTGNTVSANTSYGFAITNMTRSLFSRNVFSSNLVYGLYVNGADSNNTFVQNTFDSNLKYQIYMPSAGSSADDTFVKNNFNPSPTNPDSGVYNNTGNSFDFTRNYWNRTDSASIGKRLFDQGGVNRFKYSPFRLGLVDTAAGADTTAPKAPDTVAADGDVSDTSVIITWSAVTTQEEGVAGGPSLSAYNIYRSAVKDTSSWLQIGNTTGTVFQDTDVVPGRVFYYRVTAYDTATPFKNESFFSDSQPSDSAPLAQRVNWYVNDGSSTGDSFTYGLGSDITGLGTVNKPFASIVMAMRWATAGDTVFVDAGFYDSYTWATAPGDTAGVRIDKDSITLIGKDSNATVINPPGDSTATVYGISVLSRGNRIKNVGVTGVVYGFIFYGGLQTSVEQCSATYNGAHGLVASWNAETLTITGGNFSSNLSNGIRINANYCTVTGVTANSNAVNGIYTDGYGGHVITSNTVTSNPTGINVEQSARNIVSGNTIVSSTNGIYVGGNGAETNTISNNTLTSNATHGIMAAGANASTFSGNTITGSSKGIYLGTMSNASVTGNTSKSNTYGIEADFCSKTTFSRNVLSSNSVYGLHMLGISTDNTFVQNTFDSNVKYQVYMAPNAGVPAADTFLKNNFQPSPTNPDSAVFEGAGNTFDFTRNYWGRTDSASIGRMMADTLGITNRIKFQPFRIGLVDTAAGADTTAPKAPDTVAAAGNDTSIIVEWTAVTANEENYGGAVALSQYRIYRSAVKDTSSWAMVAKKTGIRYQDTDVFPGRIYFYRVTAFDTATLDNESFFSDSQPSDSASFASRVNWYVNDGTYSSSIDSFTTAAGSDITGEGTVSKPFASIPLAMRLATAGDTIFVDAGTYDSHVSPTGSDTAGVNIDKDSVTLIGKDSGATVIDPPGAKTTLGLYGIYAANRMGLAIKNLGVTGAYSGIYFDNVDRSTVSGDSVTACGNVGIYLDNGSDTNTVSSSTASSNTDGIYLILSLSNTVTGNTANSNTSNGIQLESSLNNTVSGNTANSNSSSGININSSSTNNTVSSNTANSNSFGININSSSNNTVSGNTTTSNSSRGIWLYGSTNSTVSGNATSSNAYGVHLEGSATGNIVSSNTATSNSYGIRLETNADTNRVVNNLFNSNTLYGIHIVSSSNNTISQNDARKNTEYQIYIQGSSSRDTSQKNNLQPSSTNPDSGVYNSTGNMFDFTRNDWNRTDSAAIGKMIFDTNSTKLVKFQPYRLGDVDTIAGADTVAPKAPDTVAVVSLNTDTAIMLEWAGVGSNEESVTGGPSLSGFRIYRSSVQDTSSWIKVWQTSGAGIRFQDTAAAVGKTYYYRVTAFDTAIPFDNESFYSDSQPSMMRVFVDTGAVTVYVSSFGDSSAPDGGDTTKAYRNINEAVAALTPNNGVDTIVVFAKPGGDSYYQQIDLTNDSGLMLVSKKQAAGADPIFDTWAKIAYDTGTIIKATPNVIIDGFFIDGIDSTRTSIATTAVNSLEHNGVYLFLSPGNVTLRNLDISRVYFGIAGTAVTNSKISNNHISDIGRDGIQIFSVATGNEIAGNTVERVYEATAHGHGIKLNSASNNTIRNNTVRRGNFGMEFVSTGAGNRIYANDILNVDTGVWFNGAFGDSFTKNNIVGAKKLIEVASTGGFDARRNWWGIRDMAQINNEVAIVTAGGTYSIHPIRTSPVDTRASTSDTISSTAPETVTVNGVSVTGGQVTITWDTPDHDDDGGNNPGSLPSYKIYRLTSTPDTTDWKNALLATVAGGVVSHVDSGLTDGTTYYYRISAYKNLGGGFENESVFSDTVSAMPNVDTTGPNIWYVNDNSTSGDSFTTAIGADTNSGVKPNKPLRNLPKLLDLLTDGDTVYIDKGLFDSYSNVSSTETAGFEIDTNNITVIGVDSAATIIDPTGPSTQSGLYGIYADTLTGLLIKNIGVTGAYDGIHFYNVDQSTVSGDSAGSCGNSGIYLGVNSDSNTVSNNTASWNTNYGIDLNSSSNNNTLTGNTAYSNQNTGIVLTSSSNNTVTGNTANSNTYDGILLFVGSNNNIVTANTCNSNLEYGIRMNTNSNNNVVVRNTTTSNVSVGISMEGSDTNTVILNHVAGNDTGVRFTGASSGNTVTKNNITGNAVNNVYNSGGLAQTLTRNFFSTTDEVAIAAKVTDTANAFRPYRLGKVDTTAGADTTAPHVPTSVTVDTSSGVSVKLTWVIPTINEETNGGSVGFAGLNIFRLVNLVDTTNWANASIIVKQTNSTDTTWTDTNVAIGNTYYYRMTSKDGAVVMNESYFKDTVVGVVAVPTWTGPVWYVDKDTGADTYTGHPNYPFKTITKAIQSIPADAQEVDTVLIDRNTYTETVVIDTDYVWLEGADSNRSVVDPPGDSLLVGLYGVYADTQTNLTIRNIGFTGARRAIYFVNVDNALITGDSISFCQHGVFLDYSCDTNTVSNNIALFTGQDGIRLLSSSGNTVRNNLVQNSAGDGIYLSASTGNTVDSNATNSNAGGYGIFLSGGSNNTVSGNTAGSNTSGGVNLVTSSNNTVSNNTVSNSTEGIYLQASSNNNTLSNNTVNLNTQGLYLSGSSNNVVSGNVSSSNTNYGVLLSNSSNNTLVRNLLYENNGGAGIYLQNADTNTFIQNESRGDRHGVLIEGSSGDPSENNKFVRNNIIKPDSWGIILNNGQTLSPFFWRNFMDTTNTGAATDAYSAKTLFGLVFDGFDSAGLGFAADTQPRFALVDTTAGGDSLAPERPSGLNVPDSCAGTVKIAWTAPNKDEAGGATAGYTGFRIYRTTNPAETDWKNDAFLAEVGASIDSYADNSVTNGVSYYYRVTSIDAATFPNESHFTDSVVGLPGGVFCDLGSMTVYVSDQGVNGNQPTLDSPGAAFPSFDSALSALYDTNGLDTIVVFMTKNVDSYAVNGVKALDTGMTIISQKSFAGTDNGGGGDSIPKIIFYGASSGFDLPRQSRIEGLTLDGGAPSASTADMVLKVIGDSVILRACQIQNDETGVQLGSGLTGFRVEQCTVTATQTGFNLIGSGATIQKSRVTSNTVYGLFSALGASHVITDNVFLSNGVGIRLGGSSSNISRNKIHGSAAEGVYLTNPNNVYANDISNNDTGVFISSASTSGNKVQYNNFFGNNKKHIKNSAGPPQTLTRNYYYATDSGVIADSVSVGSVAYMPYRFGVIDTRTTGDSIAPDMPETVAANTSTPGLVLLSWNAPSVDEDGSASDVNGQYKIYRIVNGSDDNDWYTNRFYQAVTAASLSDASVTAGNTYYYRVAAKDTAGNVGWMSDVVSATPIFSGSGQVRLLGPALAVNTTYKVGDSAVIEVNDSDPNNNPAAVNTTQCTVVNVTLGSDTIVLVLAEVGVNGTIFRETFLLSSLVSDSLPTDSELYVRAGDQIRVTYNDGGTERVVTAGILPPGLSASNASISIVNGNDHQSKAAGVSLDSDFVVTVKDTQGNLVTGATVTFSMGFTPTGSAGHALSVSSTTTDTNGEAKTRLTLGSKNDVYVVRVNVNTALDSYFTAYADGVDAPASKWVMWSPFVTPPTAGADPVATQLTGASSLIFYRWKESLTAGTFKKYESPAGQASPNNAPSTFSSFGSANGYWVFNKNAATSFRINGGVKVPDTDYYRLYVEVPGSGSWVQIGNPFAFWIDWSKDVQIETGAATVTSISVSNADTAGIISDVVYWYDEDDGNYLWGPKASPTPTGALSSGINVGSVQMKPGVGLWTRVNQSCTFVFQCNKRTVLPSSDTILQMAPRLLSAVYAQEGVKSTADAWELQLTVGAGGKKDQMNYVGVMKDPAQAARAGRYEPPSAASGYVSLNVRAPSADGTGSAMAASYTTPPADPKKALVWPVDVATDQPGQVVTVSWDNVQNLPAGYGALLRTPEGQMVDMSKVSSVSFTTASAAFTSKSYSVMVGSAEALAAALAAPLSKEQTFAYPNPGPDAATGNVTFGYNLQAATDITLKIFDVGGKLVKEQKATGAAGSNTFTWDTTNKNGQKVGSGVYIYIIEGAGNKLIDKLAIVR